MKLISLIASTVMLVSCNSKQPEKTGLEGKPLPEFNLLLSDSTTTYNTGNIPKGKPIVLFFFGPHCPYSKAQMEEIINDIDQLKDIQFYIFTTYSFKEMKDFYNHFHLEKFSNILVGIDKVDFFPQYYAVRGVPYVAIFHKDKRLNKAFIGKVNGKQIREIAME